MELPRQLVCVWIHIVNSYYMTTRTGRNFKPSKNMNQEETMDMTCMVQVLLKDRQRHEEELQVQEERVRRDEERAKREEETQE